MAPADAAERIFALWAQVADEILKKYHYNIWRLGNDIAIAKMTNECLIQLACRWALLIIMYNNDALCEHFNKLLVSLAIIRRPQMQNAFVLFSSLI